jgi:urea transport system substrate-binding protein
MGELLLIEQEFLDCSPASAFALIASNTAEGWRFDVSGGLLVPGRLARLMFTLPERMGGRTVEATGRVTCVEPGRRIVIAHETPWRGEIRFMIAATPGGARVRVVVRLDEDALAWLLRQAGIDEITPLDRCHRLGLLVSQSGPASVFAAASENLARLAVEEVNEGGGIHGRPISLLVGDDATDPVVGTCELRRLILSGCSAVLTNVTSATFRAIEPLARQAGILLVYTPVNEGGHTSSRLFRLGERPAGQLRDTVPRLMRATGGQRWYLAGNDYSWPRTTNRIAERVIRRKGGLVVGERYQPLGSRDFSMVLDEIQRSRAELVVSTFVGADEVAFERQFYEAGLRKRCQTLALALDESTREHIGDAAGVGLWTVFGYFEQLPSPANLDFLARYRNRFGSIAPPVSSISESVYEAVHLYAAAAGAAADDDPEQTGRMLCGRSFDGPRGRVTVGEPGRLSQSMYLAEAVTGGLAVREAVG